MANIDKDKLKALASDPEQTSDSIAAALGVSNLYYEFQKDPSLREVYEEGRRAARAGGGGDGKREARSQGKPKTAGRKKRATVSTPPPQR